MKFCFSFSLFLITFLNFGKDLKLSHEAEISVLTCGPGAELYSSFGHSTFRVRDPLLKLDEVFNYGSFDFTAPYFYIKFLSGKALYFLESYDYSYFPEEYEQENRMVKAQVLDLKPSDKQQLYNFLVENAKPENAYYQYDFLYDNCATRMKDVLKKILTNRLVFHKNYLMKTHSRRNMILSYLKDRQWSGLGIDIVLGSIIDCSAKPEDYMFLPEQIFQGFEHATIKTNGFEKPLVKRTEEILSGHRPKTQASLFSPLLIFSLLGLAVLWITYIDYKNTTRNRWLDFILFLTTGIIGVVVIFFWFATDHTVTKNNLNSLWAFAPNIIVAFVVLKKKPPHWLRAYVLFLFIMLIALLIFYGAQIQAFSPALVLIVILLATRYAYLWLGFKLYSILKHVA